MQTEVTDTEECVTRLYNHVSVLVAGKPFYRILRDVERAP